MLKSNSPEIIDQARRRIALRLLPFVFILYLIQYIDRFNVSLAALPMKADLGLSDSAYGFATSIFVFGYVVFEIPGVILVERWSARKWIARIMVTWGIATVVIAFIHTTKQFFLARFLLGVAEASFFPGIIVYLTHWFTQKDRARAVAAFYTATSVGAFVGAATAGWLLNVRWMGMAGWRWLFVVEGIPAVVLGVIALFYLTDWPRQAKWLSEGERSAITSALAAEHAAKISQGRLSFSDACKDSRLILLVAGYFFFLMAAITNAFWMPTFLHRLSNLPAGTVAKLVMLPSLAGLAGLFVNSWSSDRQGEYKWHTVVAMLGAGCCYLLIGPASAHFPIVVLLFALYYFFAQSVYPTFWAIPATFLSETTAAAAFGLISSISGIGSFFGPSIVGYLNDKTHSIYGSLLFIASSLMASALLLSFLRSPASTFQKQPESQRSETSEVLP